MFACIFPGQGIQRAGMGDKLFDIFKEMTENADDILGYSVKKLCLENPNNNLMQTQFTQPAVYIVNAMNYKIKIESDMNLPDMVAGHSLGEYNALLAAGIINFETGLKLVKKRSQLMAATINGGMAAVIGLSISKIIEIIAKDKLIDIDIANINSPSQIVISGPKNEIIEAKSVFERYGCKKYVILNVGGAFHSRLMKESGEVFRQYLQNVEFKEMKIPVISNVTSRRYEERDIIDLLADQIYSPVNWFDSIMYMMKEGVNKFDEIGNNQILTRMIEEIKIESEKVVRKDQIKINVNEIKKSDQEITDKTNGLIKEEKLGSSEFKKRYNIKYAYVTGSMYRGIASKEIVIKMAKSGMLGFYGSGGVPIDLLKEEIVAIKKELLHGESFGFNILDGSNESQIIELYLKYDINILEASGYVSVTPSLVKYRCKGLTLDENGCINEKNKIIAKVSRMEIAQEFLMPAPNKIVDDLLSKGLITQEEAKCSQKVPLACDLCAEADSGGHTDGENPITLLPMMLRLRDQIANKQGYNKYISVGLGGGIGTPEAVAAAFLLGADFVLTGSINQCTVEAKTSNHVKKMLQEMGGQDTQYSPAGDMFEIGAKVQVLQKGLFFPGRANMLYDIYRQYDSIDQIDSTIKKQIETNCFKDSLENVYEKCKEIYTPEQIQKGDKYPKAKMAMIFKWYFWYSTEIAISGFVEDKVNYQINCGPSLGAFNNWVKGTSYENWQNRNVDKIALLLLKNAIEFIHKQIQQIKCQVDFTY